MNNVKRVLLKLSGEALAGDKKTGFDEETVVGVAKQIKVLTEQGYEIGIIIGGGNFWRGRTSEKIDRTKADSIGMLATVMNCLYVSEIFRTEGCGSTDTGKGGVLCRWNWSSVFFNGYGNRIICD